VQALIAHHSKALLDSVTTKHPHGILLSGPVGSGKGLAAHHVAALLLGHPLEKLVQYPYFLVIGPTNSSISIDAIRDLQQFLSLRTPGSNPIRRVAIIEDAHLMTNEAQNALLKSLEEPPADTAIILTAPATKQLKDTIYSRVQEVPILPVELDQTLEHFAGQFTKESLQKAHVMSGGHAGLLHALVAQDDHPLVAEIARAKGIMAASTYERLTQVDELAKQREAVPLFLQACKLICTSAIVHAAQKGNAQTKRWHKALKAVYDAEAALPSNPNTKILLTDLFLTF
jgi:hypothetical protein